MKKLGKIRKPADYNGKMRTIIKETKIKIGEVTTKAECLELNIMIRKKERMLEVDNCFM